MKITSLNQNIISFNRHNVHPKKEARKNTNTDNTIKDTQKTPLNDYLINQKTGTREVFKKRLDEIANLYTKSEDLYNMSDDEIAQNGLYRKTTKRTDEDGTYRELCTKISDIKFHNDILTTKEIIYHNSNDLQVLSYPNGEINSITKYKPCRKKDVYYPASNSTNAIGIYAKNVCNTLEDNYFIKYTIDDVVLFDEDNKPIGFIKGYVTDYDTLQKKNGTQDAEMVYSYDAGKLTLLSKNSEEYKQLISLAPDCIDLHGASESSAFH